jgi:lipoprotein-anchoring transpeptidase ErfK/SrfK
METMMKRTAWIATAAGGGALVLVAALSVRLVAMVGGEPEARARPPMTTPAPALTKAAAVAPAAPIAMAPADLTVRRVLDVPEPMRIGDWRWDEAGVAAGPTVITVDLAAGMLSIFRGGYEIGTAAIVYGGDTKPTPLGTFPITQKDAHHISNLYHAEMPYMQRLTDDGVTIHGTEGIQSGWATHGCVGVPVAFAKKLFGATKLGDPVIVTSGKRLAMGQAIVKG